MFRTGWSAGYRFAQPGTGIGNMRKAYSPYPSNRSQPDFWTAGILTDLSLQSRNPYWRSNPISHNVESEQRWALCQDNWAQGRRPT